MPTMQISFEKFFFDPRLVILRVCIKDKDKSCTIETQAFNPQIGYHRIGTALIEAGSMLQEQSDQLKYGKTPNPNHP